MDEKYLEAIYNDGGGSGKLGSFDDFKKAIANEKYRENFYNSMGGESRYGKYEDFTSLVSGPVKKKDLSSPDSDTLGQDSKSTGESFQTTLPETEESKFLEWAGDRANEKDYDWRGFYQNEIQNKSLKPSLDDYFKEKDFHAYSVGVDGKILKSKDHPTFQKTLDAEKELGNEIIERDGKQFSQKVKPGEPVPFEVIDSAISFGESGIEVKPTIEKPEPTPETRDERISIGEDLKKRIGNFFLHDAPASLASALSLGLKLQRRQGMSQWSVFSAGMSDLRETEEFIKKYGVKFSDDPKEAYLQRAKLTNMISKKLDAEFDDRMQDDLIVPLMKWAKKRKDSADREGLVNSLKQVHNAGDFGRWALGAIVDLGAQATASVATGGTFLYAQAMGDTYLDGMQELAQKKGVSLEEILKDPDVHPESEAILFGMSIGLLEKAGLDKVLGKGKTTLAARSLMKKIKSVGAAASAESVTEGGQEILEEIGVSNIAEQNTQEIFKDLFSEKFAMQVIDAMAKGMFGGGTFSGVRTAFDSKPKTKVDDVISESQQADVQDQPMKSIEEAEKIVNAVENEQSVDQEVVEPEPSVQQQEVITESNEYVPEIETPETSISDLTDSQIEETMISLDEKESMTDQERSRYNALEVEAENRERSLFFNTPLEEVSNLVDDLISKQDDPDSFYSAFMDKSDGAEVKKVVDKYLNKEDMSTEQVKGDFKKALFGNPDKSYADGLLLRESMNELSSRGVDVNNVLTEIEQQFLSDGYSEQEAKSVIARKLASVFKEQNQEESQQSDVLQRLNEFVETEKEVSTEDSSSDQQIYNNEAIKVSEKKRKANVEPELSPDGKVYEGVGNEETVQEAKRILKDNDLETVEGVAMDRSNDMHPALRRAVLLEIAKEAKNKGDFDMATHYFDEYAELGGEGAQVIQFGNVARTDPEVETLNIIRTAKRKNEEALQEEAENGKTVKSNIDESMNAIKKIAEKEGVKVSESETVETAINKIVSAKVRTAAKVAVGKAKIKKAQDTRKKLAQEFKEKKQDLFLSSAVPGLTPQGIEYVAKVAKTYIDEGVANIEVLSAKIKGHLEQEFGKVVPENKIREAIKDSVKLPSSTKQALDDLGVNIKDLIKQHYSAKEEVSGNLRNKLVDQLGLSKKEAQDLSEAIEGEFKSLMTDQAQNELTKLYGTSKIPQKRDTKNDQEKIIEAINLGAFDTDFYSALVADKFGLSTITREDVAKLVEMSDKIQQMPPGELKNRKLQEFNDYIDSIKDVSRRQRVIDLVLDIYYTSILSGPSTLSRALKGATLTSSMNAISAAINNPVATFYGLRGIKHFIRGINQFGWDGFVQVLRDGHSDIDFFDRKVTGSGALDKIVNKPFKDHIADGDKVKAAMKVFFYLPTKMYRALLASDAVLKTGIKEYEAYIIEYNNLIESGGDRKSAQFYNQLNQQLALDQASVEQAKTQAAEEVKALRENNEEIPKGYEKRRVAELTEQNRDQKTNETAYFKANEAVLMNDPVGQLGNIYRFMSNAGIITDSDSKATMIRKFIFRTIFPFLRVPTNFINMNLDYTPYGLYRGLRGTRSTRTGVEELSKEERARHYAKAAVGSTVSAMLMMTLFDWDDEEGFILDPNAPIEITGAGTGDFAADKSIYKGYKNFSVRFKNPLTGDWSKPSSYIDNPIGMIISPLGFMSDEIRFKDFKKEVRGQEHLKQRRDMGYMASTSMYFATTFASSQSYSQGLKTLIDIVDAGNSDNDKYTEKVSKLLTNPVKGITVPNLYRQVYQQYKALMDIPERKALTLPEKLVKGTPIAEALIDGYDHDVFGYPIVRDFNFPLVPDIILETMKKAVKEREDKKEWKLIWKYPEVNIGPFRAPDYIDDKKLDDKDKREYLKKAGLEFRKLVNRNYTRLNRMDPVKLQKKLNKLRSVAIKKAKGEKLFKLDLEFDFDLDFDY